MDYECEEKEEEEEEMEYLVHVEFDSLLDCETFNKRDLFFKVIGIDTEEPVMQIGDQVFMGQYRDIPGTSLFFEEDQNRQTEDAVFAKTSEKNLRYLCKTRKSLVMRRVFIKKKKSCSPNDSSNSVLPEEVDMTDVLDQHTISNEHVFDAEVDVNISGLNEASHSQSNVSKSASNSDLDTSVAQVKTTKIKVEPVAGPSWAPDIGESDEMLEELSNSAVNADEMSRLIAEQMILESDIKMENPTCS